MTIINTRPNKLIQIGYEGEDKVTILRFSYSEKWLENGEGIFTVRVLRNGESQAYNAQVIQDDRKDYTIDMTVTDVELSKKGYGEMQLVYTGADFVKKSPVYKYYVSRSVDEAVDPPESDVYTQLIESLADLRVDFNELADMVSEVNDDIGDITELTTVNKLNIVESINEVNAKGFVSVDDELSDTSTNPVQNKVITSRIASAESVIQGKADIQTVTTLSDTVADLQTELAEKVGDVQVNGASIVTGGVANVPVASCSEFGVVKTNSNNGIFTSNGILAINNASESDIKTGTNASKPLTSHREHMATFYGLAKAAGDTTQSQSSNAVGTYTDDAKTAIQNMLDVPSTATVSAIADAVNGIDSDVQGLQTSKADTSTVTALSGTVSGLQTAVQGKADAQTVTALSGTVTGLQTSKADKSYVDTQLASKASAQTVSDLSDDVSDLQTGLASKVGDVQINGSSVVTNGVANVPIASGSGLGVVRINTAGDNYFGIGVNTEGQLFTSPATSQMAKQGTHSYKPICVEKQHESAFYGLAKVAGYDEKNSTLPVGTYSEEAKIAIQKMLGIYEAPWELINEETFTNAEEADYIITTDSNGNAFELTDLIILFETPKQATVASKGYYGHIWCYAEDNDTYDASFECGLWTQQANELAYACGGIIENKGGISEITIIRSVAGGQNATMQKRLKYIGTNNPASAFIFPAITFKKINIRAVTGTGHYVLYGKRKWT